MRHVVAILLFGSLLGAGCDDPGADPCRDVACGAWETCMEGACVPLEGRCTTYLECADDEYCDETTHTCLGPVAPPEGFFDGEGDRLTFTFRGRIGSESDYAAGVVPPAEGLFAWADGTTMAFLDNSTYAVAVPPELLEVAPQWDAFHAILVGGSRILESWQDRIRYQYLSLGLPREGLADLAAGGSGVTPLPLPSWTTLYEIDTLTREDRVTFKRSCPVAWTDPADGPGALFLFAPKDTAFEPGEALLIAGNIPLTTRLEITADNESDQCSFTRNGATITAQEYHEGLTSEGYELSCDFPQDTAEAVATLFAPDGATVVFSGPINDPADGFAAFEQGLGTATIEVDGVRRFATDYYMLAYLYPLAGRDHVYVQGVGSVASLGTDHFSYSIFRLMVAQEALQTAASTDATFLTAPPDVSVTLEDHEVLTFNNVDLYRICPVAVLEPTDATGLGALCATPGALFEPGENLELAASMALTADPAVLESVYGPFDTCYCYMASEYNPMDCADFDDYVAQSEAQ